MAESGLSQYSHQALLNALLGKTSAFGTLSSRPTFYVAASSTKPTTTGGNVTEPSTGAYARVETAPADWTAATDADPSVIENAEIITFPEATADWLAGGNLGFAPIYDAAENGNFLGFGEWDQAKPVLDGDTLRFPAGALNIHLLATPDP
jgi:hypothetical protein